MDFFITLTPCMYKWVQYAIERVNALNDSLTITILVPILKNTYKTTSYGIYD